MSFRPEMRSQAQLLTFSHSNKLKLKKQQP